MTVVGLDNDGATITGSQYDLPIQISASDPSISVSVNSLAGPANSSVTVSYNGSTAFTSGTLTFQTIFNVATSGFAYLFQQVNIVAR